jgi:hypothetical protein
MAAGTTSIDALMADAISKMDALTKRMDALETGEGSKTPIKGDDDRAKRKDDAAKSKADDDDDDDKKDDAVSTVKSKILADAEGASEKDDAASVPNAPSPVKGDKRKADAKKNDDGELEIKHKGEEKGDSRKKADAKAKSDDDDDKKDDDDDDDKKSDDDDDKKDDAAKKADSVGVLRRQIDDQAATIARLERMMKPKTDDEHAAFADAQARADTVYQGFGKHAPRPLEGEGLMDYRKRLATNLKMHSSMWKNVKLSKLDEEAFSPIETQIYSDAASAAANPLDLEAGELRMVTKIDPTTGVRSNVFYGKESFVKQMGRPGRRVASFRTLGSV